MKTSILFEVFYILIILEKHTIITLSTKDKNLYILSINEINMNKWIELLFGLILVIGGVLLWYFTLGSDFWDFGAAAWEILKGGIVWFILGIGLLFILLGISDLKG